MQPLPSFMRGWRDMTCVVEVIILYNLVSAYLLQHKDVPQGGAHTLPS